MADIAASIPGIVVKVVQRFIEQYDEMKTSDEVCRNTLKHLKILLSLLNATTKQDYLRQPQEVKKAIEEIFEVFNEYEKKCFKRIGKNGIVKFVFPKKNEQMQMQTDISQCTASLTLALQVAAKEDRQIEETRRKHEAKFSRMTAHDGLLKGSLKPVKMNPPQYMSDGGVALMWQDDNENNAVQNYEFEIIHDMSAQKSYIDKIPSGQRRLSVEPFMFSPLETYTIRARAKSISGGPAPSEWSESKIIRVPHAPPNKPKVPPELFSYYCSDTESSNGDIDSVVLSITCPTDEECNGKPLKKIMIYWSDKNATSMSALFLKDPTVTNGKVKVPISNEFIPAIVNTDHEIMFRVAFVNECGESEHSDSLIISMASAVPGMPTSVRESSKKTSNLIKIRWDKPTENAFAVDHYDIQMLNKNGSFKSVTEAYKCSATIRKLKQNKNYTFRICSVNAKGKRSQFTDDIVIETCFSNAVIGAMGGAGVAGGIAAGFVGGIVSGPAAGIGAGVLAGTEAADKVKNKFGKAIVGTLAGVAAGVPATVGMTLLTPISMVAGPIIGGAAAVAITKEVMEDDWSDQSSDYEVEEDDDEEEDEEEDDDDEEKEDDDDDDDDDNEE